MRKLKTEKTIKIDNEAVVKVEINKVTEETTVTIAAGYVKDNLFMPMEDFKEYKVKGHTVEQSETIYFVEVDKQNSPTIDLFGLTYRAKQAGVKVIYSAKDNLDILSVDVTDKTIEVKIEPLVTTNQEIIDVIQANIQAMDLLYRLEIIDIDADVDLSLAPTEIK